MRVHHVEARSLLCSDHDRSLPTDPCHAGATACGTMNEVDVRTNTGQRVPWEDEADHEGQEIPCGRGQAGGAAILCWLSA